MANRKHKRPKQPIHHLPAILLILVAVSLLGLVVKVSISQAGRVRSDSLPPTSEAADSRWAYIMTNLIGITRHFKGSPDAPVTILEFSDFQ